MRKKTILALVVAVLMLVTAVYAQSTRAITGVGRVRPSQMTKGARVVPMMFNLPVASSTGKRWFVADDTAGAGRLKFPLPMFPVNGYVANFYIMGGLRCEADTFLFADTVVTKAYRFSIYKNTSLLGRRRTCASSAVAATQILAKPSPNKWYFITGTDTTSRFNVLTTDTLWFVVDTCGGAPDSLPRNIQVKYEWYPADKQ